MMSADKIAVRSQMTVLLSPDQKLPDMQWNCLTLLATFENFQLHIKHGDDSPLKSKVVQSLKRPGQKQLNSTDPQTAEPGRSCSIQADISIKAGTETCLGIVAWRNENEKPTAKKLASVQQNHRRRIEINEAARETGIPNSQNLKLTIRILDVKQFLHARSGNPQFPGSLRPNSARPACGPSALLFRRFGNVPADDQEPHSPPRPAVRRDLGRLRCALRTRIFRETGAPIRIVPIPGCHAAGRPLFAGVERSPALCARPARRRSRPFARSTGTLFRERACSSRAVWPRSRSRSRRR